MKLKGIVFPIFFSCIVGIKTLQIPETKTEEILKKPPIPSPVKIKNKLDYNRFMTTPSPESSFVKRANRLTSPALTENLIRKLTPKEFIRRKSNLRPKTTSLEKISN